MGGLAFGCAVVLIRSKVDTSIQAPGRLGIDVNLRELGVIPSARLDPELRAIGRRSARAALAGIKSWKKGKAPSILATPPEAASAPPLDSLELVTWTRKPSVIAEAFRSSMASILFSSENGDQPRVLVITSPSSQEGKTTVVSNLAIALAEINHRVLLIDADMRLPRLHTVFDLPNTFGLSDVLYERKPIEEYSDEELVRKTHIPELYVLSAGPARTSLSRLLYSSRMRELIARCRRTFDTILIDSAPVLSVPDARILARVSDAVVLVLRAHRTHQEAALAAVQCFEEDGRRVLGTILNDWNPHQSAYGTYGGAYRPYGYGGYPPPPHSADDFER
jgi:capsular exopolysaccharide synthesis family protein